MASTKMEDQTQSGAKPKPEILKIRTMRDDLKKASGQAQGPTPMAQTKPLAAGQNLATAPKPPAPPVPPAPPLRETTIRPLVAPRMIPEPPMHLPGAVIGPEPTKSIAPPMPPARPPAPPPIISSKPTPAPAPALPKPPPPPAPKPIPQAPPPASKPVFNEPIKKPVWPSIAPASEKTTSSGVSKFLMIVGFIFVLAAASASVYFIWLKKTPTALPPEPICEGKISPECPPVSMITGLKQLTIDAQNHDQIVNDIKTKISPESGPTAKLIILKTSSAPDAYATFDEFINLFGLSMSSAIKKNTANYNLVVYKNQVQQTSSKEIRLVLVLKQNSESQAKESMQIWEDEMVGDLEPLLLETPHDPPLKEFLTRIYNKGNFRYYSMPNYKLTINYVITGDYLIIGTSRDSIFYVYDAITSKK